MSRTLVLGGSGQIGRYLIPQLLDHGHQVLALSRLPRTSSRQGLEWIQGDLFAGMPDIPAVESIFSLGPLNGFAAWLATARLAGRPRIVAFGSMSASSKRDSDDPAERALAQTLRQGEQTLADAAQHAGLDWTLLRPTLIYGAGLDRSLTPLARLGTRWHVFPWMPAASGLRQPVHAEDLAVLCRVAASLDAASGRSFDVGGGERLAFSLMLERVRRSLTSWTIPLPIAPAPLRLTLALARRSSRWRELGPAIVERLGKDLLADDQAARRELQWSPRPFRPHSTTWLPTVLP